MKKISIIRHAESVGNMKKIIQSSSYDEGITWSAILKLEKSLEMLHSQLDGIDCILYSDSKRTWESMEIVSRFVDTKQKKELTILREIDAGILAGQTHKFVEDNLSEVYAIWLDRRDLDRIPFAETGDHLQARILITLYYSFLKFENPLLITHAAYMRCLINTNLLRSRTTAVDVAHYKMHVMKNNWNSICSAEYKNTKHKKIFLLKTYEKRYILKHYINFNMIDMYEKELIKVFLSAKLDCFPQEVYRYEENEQCFIIEEYIKQDNLQERLTLYQSLLVVRFTYELHQNCKYLSKKFTKIRTLKSQLIVAMNECKNEVLCRFTNKLINIVYASYSDDILTYSDIHRDNVIIQNGLVKIVDNDSWILAPEMYQLACLICGFFYLHDYSEKDLSHLLTGWNEYISFKQLQYFVFFRAFIGYEYFENRRANEVLRKKYREILVKIKEDYEIDNKGE